MARDRDADGVSSDSKGRTDSGDGVTYVGGAPTSSLEERTYAQNDANFNVTSLISDPKPGTQAAVVERNAYLPYGQAEVLSATWTDVQFTRLDNPYRFQGLRQDAATGLHHARFRDFADWLGRWTQQDPAGWPDGVGRSEFVRGGPLRFNDPNGLQTQPLPTVSQGIKISDASSHVFGQNAVRNDAMVTEPPAGDKDTNWTSPDSITVYVYTGAVWVGLIPIPTFTSVTFNPRFKRVNSNVYALVPYKDQNGSYARSCIDITNPG